MADEWREARAARAAAAAAAGSTAAHLWPRLAVGGSALTSPEQVVGDDVLASQEQTAVPSQPGLEPAASHLVCQAVWKGRAGAWDG